MPESTVRFDPESVREAWDRAADAFVEGQTSGLDYYRLDFLGPAQVEACGDVRGARLLDVGCGGGYLARELAARGARVTGIDLSPRMIEHARRREEEAPLGIEYQAMDAAEIAAHFPADSFDMAVSCVALQDMPDPAAALRAVHTVLRPGGRFVASITHPCTDTPFRAWERDEARRKRWLCVDRYFERAPIELEWQRLAYKFTTAGLHVPLEDWFGWVLAAGFQLRAFREPRPTDEALRRRPELEDATRMPYFISLDLARG
ncbi:MAG TPA: methyltransferase domain-containing protein [Longimicrobium sp.]|nr:methyltransferase domain-containing protein [Longimicrobium sp.]